MRRPSAARSAGAPSTVRRLDFSLGKSTRIGGTIREIRAHVLHATSERLHRTDLASTIYANNNLLTHPFVGSTASDNALFNPRTIQMGTRLSF